MMQQIVQTQDGSSSIVSEVFPGELYHSERGAIGEAQHVYIRFLSDGARVLEIGFGSGLNTLLSLRSGFNIRYDSVELYPISLETARNLSFYCSELESLHAAKWGEQIAINNHFTLKKLNIDITNPWQLTENLAHDYNLIFFDAFAPDVVPAQWSEEVFRTIHQRMSEGGILVTYSAKGVVKQALRAAGFTVRRLQGALGKHNMVMATKEPKDTTQNEVQSK